jgi:hypothetical protein
MAKLYQNNFVGGVISPSLYARSDLQAYYKSAALAENFVITKEGSCRKRRGLISYQEFDAADGWDFSKCRIIPYHYDRTTGGVLLLHVDGPYVKARMYDKSEHHDAPLIADVNVYRNQVWDEETETYVDVDLEDVDPTLAFIKDLQYSIIGDTFFLTCTHFYKRLVVSNFADEDREMNVYNVEQTPKPDAIPAADFTIQRSEVRAGKTIYYSVTASMNGVNSDQTKASCTWDATWVAGKYIDLHVDVKVEDLDKYEFIMFGKRAGAYYGELARVYMTDTPDKFLDANKGETTDEDAIYYRWTFRDENHEPGELIYDQTNVLGEGFDTPWCINAFQQRLVLANGVNAEGDWPMTLWFSETANIYNFYADRPVDESDPFSPTINATGPAFIRWLIPYQDSLVVFTETGIFQISGSKTDGFSYKTCTISLLSSIVASAKVQPISTESGVTFVGADQKTVYTMAYDITTDQTKPINRIVLASHLTMKSPITSMALQMYPDCVIWCVLADGSVLSFTNMPEEEVYAWSSHKLGNGKFKAFAVISTDTVTDSTTGRTYADITWIMQDEDTMGFSLASMRDACNDAIGEKAYNVKATLTTLRPEMQDRTIVGEPKNIKDTVIRVFETGGIAVKTANGDIEAVRFPQNGTFSANNLYTGDVKLVPRGYVNDLGQLTIVSDNNQPCEILAVLQKLEIS